MAKRKGLDRACRSSREAPAEDLSIGVTLLDRLAKDGPMPPSRHAKKRRVWSRLEPERAFSQHPGATWSGAADLSDMAASSDDHGRKKASGTAWRYGRARVMSEPKLPSPSCETAPPEGRRV